MRIEAFTRYNEMTGDAYVMDYTQATAGKRKVCIKEEDPDDIASFHLINPRKTTWKKCKYANGYQIYYSKNKKFNKISKKVNIKGGSITTYTAKNLKKGKKYYVKVRAYKYIDNKKIYGKWSNVKSVKCK